MKRIFVLLLSCLMVFSCAKPYGLLHFESVTLKSVTPTGLRTMNMVLAVTYDNRGAAYEVTEPVVTVKMSGTPLMTLSADTLSFGGRTRTVLDCAVRAEIADGQNIISIMKVFGGKFDANAATVDISFRYGRPGKAGMKFDMKNRPVGKLLDELI